jgi:prepilin-type N-terminal cleavage/methylation domain-containing protein
MVAVVFHVLKRSGVMKRTIPFETIWKSVDGKGSLRGFTLVEVIASLMIILIAVTGIFASLIAAARYVRNSKDRITSVDFSRLRLEGLRQSVRQDTWNSADLKVGANNTTSYTIGNFTYNLTYDVNATSGDYRKVTIAANYTVPD